jgi:hypothetical protein
MDENYDKYKDKFTHAKMMSMANLVAYLDIGILEPLHEGTIRYLKEKNLWKPQYQARQDKIVALAQARVKAYKAALEMATDKGLSTVPGNKDWVALWANYRKEHGLTKSFGEEILALD